MMVCTGALRVRVRVQCGPTLMKILLTLAVLCPPHAVLRLHAVRRRIHGAGACRIHGAGSRRIHGAGARRITAGACRMHGAGAQLHAQVREQLHAQVREQLHAQLHQWSRCMK